jgi:hypothetical protein
MMAEKNIDPLIVNISPIGRKNQMPFAVLSIKIKFLTFKAFGDHIPQNQNAAHIKLF